MNRVLPFATLLALGTLAGCKAASSAADVAAAPEPEAGKPPAKIDKRGTCASPLVWDPEQVTGGSIPERPSLLEGSCGGSDSPEHVYVLEIDERLELPLYLFARSAALSSSLEAFYLRTDCNDPGSEIACVNPDGVRRRAEVDWYAELEPTLDPGRYFVVIDGSLPDSNYDIRASLNVAFGPKGREKLCAEADSISPGKTLELEPRENRFGGRGLTGVGGLPDEVRRLDLEGYSRVRFGQSCEGDESDCRVVVLSDCTAKGQRDPSMREGGDYRRLRPARLLDAGTYYVVSEAEPSGKVFLTVLVEPAEGSGVVGDSCSSAPPLELGKRFTLDTFRARDDFAVAFEQGGNNTNTRGAPDVFRRLDLKEPSYVALESLPGPSWNNIEIVVAWTRGCGERMTVVEKFAANLGDGILSYSKLDAGRYFLVIDGARPNQMGQVDLLVRIEPHSQFERACRQAPILRFGKKRKGRTRGYDRFLPRAYFEAAPLGDAVFRMVVKRPALVRVTATSEERWFYAVSIRDDCIWQAALKPHERERTAEATRERPGDPRSPSAAVVEADLGPGTYYVIFNGGLVDKRTPFSIKAEIVKEL
jgi:hypothetical protein